MALTTGEMSAADIAAVTDGGKGGWGCDGSWWLIVLFLFAFSGNWGGFGGNNGTNAEVQRGFDQSAVMSALNGINSNMVNSQLGFLQTLNDNHNALTAQLMQMQMAQQNSCFENRLGLAGLNATILAENCANRAAISDGVRDILTNQNMGIQRILDQMCNDKIDAKNEKIADLERQLTMANLAASQGAQTAAIIANNEAQTAALEQYLAPVPRPAYIVQNPNGCNCGTSSCCGTF